MRKMTTRRSQKVDELFPRAAAARLAAANSSPAGGSPHGDSSSAKSVLDDGFGIVLSAADKKTALESSPRPNSLGADFKVSTRTVTLGAAATKVDAQMTDSPFAVAAPATGVAGGDGASSREFFALSDEEERDGEAPLGASVSGDHEGRLSGLPGPALGSVAQGETDMGFRGLTPPGRPLSISVEGVGANTEPGLIGQRVDCSRDAKTAPPTDRSGVTDERRQPRPGGPGLASEVTTEREEHRRELAGTGTVPVCMCIGALDLPGTGTPDGALGRSPPRLTAPQTPSYMLQGCWQTGWSLEDIRQRLAVSPLAARLPEHYAFLRSVRLLVQQSVGLGCDNVPHPQ